MVRRTDYEQIAPTYDARYARGLYNRLERALRELVDARKPDYVLEAGCGTGYWLASLRGLAPHIVGIDFSAGMLAKARERDPVSNLVRAAAEVLPFRGASFDLIFCLNAIHHFNRFDAFIAEAKRLLRPGGMLAVIGMDPHHGRDYWCIYDYFPETRPTDLVRYPSSGKIADAMLAAGFEHVECSVACRFSHTRRGAAVFNDPELQRNGCSQMALLTDEQYAQGIARIRSAVQNAKDGETPTFKVDIAMMLVSGVVGAANS
jgi:ubiquinone/menaquinone biosynthesis C-methylase UbiE